MQLLVFLSNIYWCLAVVECTRGDNKNLWIVDRQKHELYIRIALAFCIKYFKVLGWVFLNIGLVVGALPSENCQTKDRPRDAY